MKYQREMLVTGKYKACTGPGGANEDNRLVRYDRKTVKPFLDAIHGVFAEYGLMLQSNDLSCIVTDYDKELAGMMFRTTEVDVSRGEE